MKKSLIATLIALPLLALSSTAFADEPTQAVTLSAAQMDGVTAGGRMSWSAPVFAPSFVYQPVQQVSQVNNSTVTVLQIGNNNSAFVFSGNVFVNM